MVSGGSGYLNFFRQTKDGTFEVSRIATRKGARTSLWIPATNQWVIAIPRKSGQPAELRIYKLTNQSITK